MLMEFNSNLFSRLMFFLAKETYMHIYIYMLSGVPDV